MRHRRTRLLSRLVLAAGAASVLVLGIGMPNAQAHAFLTRSNPADGAVLETAPTRLVLDFSESVVLTGMRVSVVDGAGRELSVGEPRLVDIADGGTDTTTSPRTTTTEAPAEASVGAEREAPASVAVDLPPLDRGAYRVSWATVSSDDLHRTAGVLVFGIQTTVTAAGWVESAPAPLETVLRWLVLVAVAVGIGAPVARRLLRRAGLSASAEGQVASIVAAGAVIGVAAAIALLADQVVASGGAAQAFDEGAYAVRWISRALGLLILLAAAVTEAGALRTGREAAARRARPAALLGVGMAAVGTALLGHAGSGATGSPTATMVATVHSLATGCWMGTLALLVIVLARVHPSREQGRVVLIGFAGPACVAVAVTVVTGLMLASDLVGSLDALLLTDYGRLLMLKVAVVGVLLLLGGLTHIRLRRSARPVGRLVAVEAVTGVLVLLLSGAVTSGQPALEPQLLLDPSTPPSTTVYQQISDLHESLSIRPNLPGQNVAVLQVTDTRRPSPGRVTGVRLVVSGPGSTHAVVATRIDDIQWSVPLTLTDSGPGAMWTEVERVGLPTTSGGIAWTTGWPPGSPQTLVSRSSLRPTLLASAWFGVALLAGGLLVALRRAARRPAFGLPLGARPRVSAVRTATDRGKR